MTAAMERNAPDSYSRRQRNSDAEYARQYTAWVESLPPDQRGQLWSGAVRGSARLAAGGSLARG